MSEEKPATKASIYKKWWFWLIIAFVIIAGAGASGTAMQDSTNGSNETSVDEPDKAPEDETDPLMSIMSKAYDRESEEYSISKAIYRRTVDYAAQYRDVVIDSITVNENAGTPAVDDDYIVLVNLTWNRMNNEENTKKMMRLYCDDIAAAVIDENKHAQEIAMFWTIPYHKENTVSAKCSYEQKNGKMYLSDKMGLVGD